MVESMEIEEKKLDTDTTNFKPDDPIQKTMGAIGKWQIIICGLLFLLKFPVAWHQLANIFLSPPASFECANTTVEPCSKSCEEIIFDNSVFSETIITKFGLVCEYEYLSNLSQTIFMLGILLGNLGFGTLADKFGRRIPLIVAVFMQLIFGTIVAFSPWFWFFCLTRFLTGVATGGTMITSFVIIMEIVGIKWRELVSILYQVPFYLGHLVLPGIAYFLRNWKHFQLAVSLFSIILISYCWFVPESPRWLLLSGRIDTATKILEEAARQNKIQVENIQSEVNTYYKNNVEGKEIVKGNIWDLFRTPNLRKRTICMYYNWFTSGFVFFGVAQYISKIGGDIFLNVTISAALEIPGNFFCIYITRAWGRKWSLIFANLLAGVPMLCIATTQNYYATIILASAAIIGTSISFPTVYLFAGELFPTVVRNVGIGGASVIARIGSMVAPFIASLATEHYWLPPIIFGAVGVLGAILCIFLPETRGEPLPATIEDAEKFSSK